MMGQHSRNVRRAARNIGRMPSAEPSPEYVPRTENEETRRAMRDWLRQRGDDDVIEFEEAEF